MRAIRRFRPSAAMLVALTAVLIALAGTAAADPGGQLSRLISGSSIKKNSIPGDRLRKQSVAGDRLTNNTLAGKQIKESTLGTVPSATNATKVGGAALSKISFRAPAGTASTTLLDTGRLRLAAACNAAGELTLIASTTVDHAQLTSYGNGADTKTTDFTVAAAPLEIVGAGAASQSQERTLVYTEPAGQIVQVTFLAQGGLTAQGVNRCVIAGFATVA